METVLLDSRLHFMLIGHSYSKPIKSQVHKRHDKNCQPMLSQESYFILLGAFFQYFWFQEVLVFKVGCSLAHGNNKNPISP